MLGDADFLRLFHLMGLVGWLGAASADIVLEVLLKKSSSPSGQRLLMRCHALTDRFIEGPGLIVAGITGFLLLADRGYLRADAVWPTWFKWKIAAGVAVLFTNACALIFVYKRYRASELVPEAQSPMTDPRVTPWIQRTMITSVGVPLAVVALVLAGLYGR